MQWIRIQLLLKLKDGTFAILSADTLLYRNENFTVFSSVFFCNIWYIHVSYLLMKFDCNNCKSMVQLKSCKVLITILHMQHSFTFTYIRNNLHMLIIKFPITVLKEYNFKFKARHILLRESQNYKLVIKHIFSFS